MLLFPLVSCANFFSDIVQIRDVIQEKEKIDKADNPALKYIMKQELSEKLIEINNALVKDVIESTNIDYDYCVVVEVQTPQGGVECYIFSKNIKIISRLVKNKTRIDVKGEFGRFFTMLDQYYTKIEIVKARVNIYEGEKK